MPAPRIPCAGGGSCVLALVLHPGYSGYAALDGWGLKACRTTHLLHDGPKRAAMLVQLVTDLVRRYRPARVVLGIPPRDTDDTRTLRMEAVRVVTALHVLVTTRPLHQAKAALGFRVERGTPDGLASHLAHRFFPQLIRRLTRDVSHFWYRRSAWHALAIALTELVEFRPFAAAALVPASGHAIAAFAHAVQAAALRV